MKKYFYIWKGQNATCGRPNPLTGRLNMYGDLLAFTSKSKRDQFYNEYYDNNPSVKLYKCNKKSARKFFLGMPVYNFENDVLQFANMDADQHFESYFGVNNNE